MQARVESPIVRDILELAPSNFIDAKEDVLMLGPPGVGTSHRAKALALFSVQRSDKVIYREAHTEVLMSRYEKHPTIITSNRPLEDWAKLLGDVVLVTPLRDRLMHHGHLLQFRGRELAPHRGCGERCQTAARVSKVPTPRSGGI